jgi:hypothetical protein
MNDVIDNPINGRYRTRNGRLVAVHDNLGHPINEIDEKNGIAIIGYELKYDKMGCSLIVDWDLMERVEWRDRSRKTKVVGCKLCEKEN